MGESESRESTDPQKDSRVVQPDITSLDIESDMIAPTGESDVSNVRDDERGDMTGIVMFVEIQSRKIMPKGV